MGHSKKIIIVNELNKGGISTYINSLGFDSENILDLSKLSSSGNSFVKICKAIFIIIKRQPKLLICVEDLPSIVGFFYNHSKVIITIHRNPDLNYSTLKGYVFKLIYKYLFSNKTRFVGVSKNQSKSLSKLISKDVKYRYTSIISKRRNKLIYKPKTLTFLYASRIEPEKGINEMINTFLILKNILNSNKIEAQLKIYGNFVDQKFKIQLQNLINSNDSICYNGSFSNVEELVNNVSPVFLNFSHHEGFGLINWEMLDLGIPSIIYNCNYGVSELIIPKFNQSKFGPLLTNSFDLNEKEVEFIKSLARDEYFYYKASKNSLICSDEFRLKVMKNNSIIHFSH